MTDREIEEETERGARQEDTGIDRQGTETTRKTEEEKRLREQEKVREARRESEAQKEETGRCP